jgi:hypothetical protein
VARYMSESSKKIYRVVILERAYLDPNTTIKTMYGPYERAQSAGFVKSYMTNGYWSRSRIVDAWVETAEPSWGRIDANK